MWEKQIPAQGGASLRPRRRDCLPRGGVWAAKFWSLREGSTLPGCPVGMTAQSGGKG